MPPNIPMPTITLATTVTTAGRMVKSRSGMSAACRILASAPMNASRPMPAMTKQVIERPVPQPHSRPCSSTASSGTRQTHSARAPIQSIGDGRRTWWTWRVRKMTTSATSPIGTLTRKTHRQPVMPRIESLPARRPPITGPSTLEEPNVAMK